MPCNSDGFCAHFNPPDLGASLSTAERRDLLGTQWGLAAVKGPLS